MQSSKTSALFLTTCNRIFNLNLILGIASSLNRPTFIFSPITYHITYHQGEHHSGTHSQRRIQPAVNLDSFEKLES